jgi:large subunit ribosomal protein L24
MKFAQKISSQPRKKRKALYHAYQHLKQKLVSAHLSRELRKSLKKRSLPVRKGDKVVVFRGKFKKKEGLVSKVDLNSLKVFVEGILSRKQSGKEVLAPVEPSNLVITQLVERKIKAKKSKTKSVKEIKKETKVLKQG